MHLITTICLIFLFLSLNLVLTLTLSLDSLFLPCVCVLKGCVPASGETCVLMSEVWCHLPKTGWKSGKPWPVVLAAGASGVLASAAGVSRIFYSQSWGRSSVCSWGGNTPPWRVGLAWLRRARAPHHCLEQSYRSKSLCLVALAEGPSVCIFLKLVCVLDSVLVANIKLGQPASRWVLKQVEALGCGQRCWVDKGAVQVLEGSTNEWACLHFCLYQPERRKGA